MLNTINIHDGIKSTLLFEKLKITHIKYTQYLAYLEFLELVKVVGKYDQVIITEDGEVMLDAFECDEPKDFN